jgi:galactokinase
MTRTFTSSAPGRMDVMGGFSDYSGGLVLQMPIANTTEVSVTLRDDFVCSIKSEAANETPLFVSFEIKELISQNFSLDLAHLFFSNEKIHWSAYVVGCGLLLHHLKKINFSGADFRVKSNVPLGKGVSSSAALEVATMKALTQAYELKFTGTELPILAQKVENLIVGAPCGLMDQLTSFHGIPNHLLPITCQPDVLHDPIAIPSKIKFIGIDSGVRHAVSGSSYTDVRCAAFMGYSIIAQRLGVDQHTIQEARDSGNWSQLPYGGYLCNISALEFIQKFQSILPEKISGRDFTNQFRTTIDSVTAIQPEKTYFILNCVSHPIQETERVKKFKSILESVNQQSITKNQLHDFGQLMYQAHAGYTACRLNSDRTDEIVALGKQHQGIAGAKITGGGSGGTVCLLAVGDEGLASAKKIHQHLEEKYKTSLVFFG